MSQLLTSGSSTKLNRDAGLIKLVAMVSMLIDHVGAVFFSLYTGDAHCRPHSDAAVLLWHRDGQCALKKSAEVCFSLAAWFHYSPAILYARFKSQHPGVECIGYAASGAFGDYWDSKKDLWLSVLASTYLPLFGLSSKDGLWLERRIVDFADVLSQRFKRRHDSFDGQLLPLLGGGII